MENMLKISDVWPGDMLLCRGRMDGVSPSAWVRQEIANATTSPYTHAAIARRDGEIADARILQGVCVRHLDTLIEESNHIAVFRMHPGLWTNQTLDALQHFTNALHAQSIGYNHRPFWKWIPMSIEERRLSWKRLRENHELGIQEELFRYFDEGPPVPSNPYRSYFCSELVVACINHCGLIDQSAAVIYKPEVHAPGDLVKDPTFGFLVGFLSSTPSSEVPNNDPLLNATRYRDIYP